MRTALISRHQINISAISAISTITSSNQLTQHYNHIMLNSTHSSLSSCPSEHQCITRISNSETTPAGTKHFQVMCMYVCMRVCVRPFADSPDQQTSHADISRISSIIPHIQSNHAEQHPHIRSSHSSFTQTSNHHKNIEQ